MDDAVTSIGVFAPQLKTVVSLYGAEPQGDLGGVAEQSSAQRAFHKRKREYLQHANAVVQLGGANARCDEAVRINQDCPINPLSVIEVYEQVHSCETAGNLHVDSSVTSLLRSIAAIRQRGVRERDNILQLQALSPSITRKAARRICMSISQIWYRKTCEPAYSG